MLEVSNVTDFIRKKPIPLLRFHVHLFWNVALPTGNRVSASCCGNKDVPQSVTLFSVAPCALLATPPWIRRGKKSTRPRCSRGRKSTNISHNTQQSRTGGSVKHVGSTLAVKSIRCSCVGAVCPNLTKPGRGRRWRAACGAFSSRFPTKQDVAAGKSQDINHPG